MDRSELFESGRMMNCPSSEQSELIRIVTDPSVDSNCINKQLRLDNTNAAPTQDQQSLYQIGLKSNKNQANRRSQSKEAVDKKAIEIAKEMLNYDVNGKKSN